MIATNSARLVFVVTMRLQHEATLSDIEPTSKLGV
jgi:hypothetical protein